MKYMTEAEIHPWYTKFIDWIESIRKEVRSKGITFDCRLVGSARRHLVIPHHNKGFDLDFQIIIHKNKNNKDEEQLKQLFMGLINPLVTAEGFEDCEDSTSSITTKMIDKNRANIKVGYDVVIIRNKTVNNVVQTEILRHYRKEKPERWAFEQLPDMTDASKQFAKIRGIDMWQDLRKRYYDKKTKNTDDKRSFQLLHEAVNETLKKFGV